MTPLTLPIGKLPPDLLARLTATANTTTNARVIVGPGLGLDCAVLDFGDRYLIAKTDPITFATDAIGWYAVQINANDIACAGATPKFFLATVLLPEVAGNAQLAESIFAQLTEACAALQVAVVGGHTEITYDLNRPLVIGTMLGEVAKDQLITAAGAQVGDSVILTKGYPIEAIAIIARELAVIKNAPVFPADFIEHCRAFLHVPGISVVRDAHLAVRAGRVTAMHDPTEGGVASGLWELAEASQCGIEVDRTALPLLPEGEMLCKALGLDPLGCIASGALLLTTPDAAQICAALEAAGIPAHRIGVVTAGKGVNLPRPVRDEIAKLF